VLIVALAAALRLVALDFGLPNVYHPDEDALVMPAMTILKSGDFQPIRMDYGTFFIYILAAVHLLVFIASARSGAIERVDELVIMERGAYPGIYPHPEYVLAGRLVSAAFGIGIVVVTYMLGRRLGGPRLGLLAAALAAVLPDLVIHSHFATTDTAATLMVLLALYLLLRAYDNWERDTLWAYAGAGFACGLAVATKYSNAFIAVPLLLVPLLKLRSLDELLRARVLAGPLAMGLGFLAGTPYALLNLPEFAYWAGYVLRAYHRPFYDPVGATWQWQLGYLLGGRNALVVIPGIIGFFVSFYRWGRRGWISSSFALIFFYTILTQDARQSRSWLPLAPIFALWATLTLDSLWGWLRMRLQNRTPINADTTRIGADFFNLLWTSPVNLLVLLLLVPLLWLSLMTVRTLAADDVRTLTQQWIEQNVPPGTTLSFDRFPANVDPAVWPVVNVFGHYQHNLAWYQENGVGYLFAGDVIHDPEQLSAEDTANYRALLAELCPVETLTGSILATAGRQISIYRFPPCEE
jgi:4-amino-4-deoxy-L-arabinose transferase-like glycosyltransferase